MGNKSRAAPRRGRPFALKIKQKHELHAEFIAWLYGQAEEMDLDPDLVRAALRRSHTALLWPVRMALLRKYRGSVALWAKRLRVSHMTIRRELDRVDIAELRRAS